MYSYRNTTGLGKVKSSHMSHTGTKCCMQTETAPDLSPTLSFLLLGKPKPRLIVTCPYHPSLVENSDPNRLAVACLPGIPDTIQLLNSWVGHWAMWMQYKCALPIPSTISRPRVSLGFHQSSISPPAVFEIEWSGGLKMSVVCLFVTGVNPAWSHNDRCWLFYLCWFCTENHL